MKALARLFPYYRPHMRLFLLDIGVAVVATLASIIFPMLTRQLLGEYIPAQDSRMIVSSLSILAALVVVKGFCMYIRVKWGHILGVRMEYDMRSDLFQHLQKLSFT